MNKFWLVGLALATALATVPAASADSFYVTITGVANSGATSGTSGVGHVSGSAVLTGTEIGLTGNYNITSASYTSITVDGITFTNPTIVTNSTPGAMNSTNLAYYFDNVLNLSSPYVSSGILFQLPGSPWAFMDIYLDGGGDVLSIANADGTEFDPGVPAGYDVTLNVSETPEPSSLLLLGTGLLLMAGFLFRKVKPGMNQSL